MQARLRSCCGQRPGDDPAPHPIRDRNRGRLRPDRVPDRLVRAGLSVASPVNLDRWRRPAGGLRGRAMNDAPLSHLLSRRAAELRAKLARPAIVYWIEIAAVLAALIFSSYWEFFAS
jgi:hypothetical protein